MNGKFIVFWASVTVLSAAIFASWFHPAIMPLSILTGLYLAFTLWNFTDVCFPQLNEFLKEAGS